MFFRVISAISVIAVGVLAVSTANAYDVEQVRGVDQRVKYDELEKFGPWDDRNYNLTKEDLALLAPNEDKLHPQIPAFFRVELRKEWPHLKRSGAAQYPRAARQVFKIRHGGLMRYGKVTGEKWGSVNRVPAPVNSEVQLNQVLGANEVTVEINPANPSRVIAGSNNNGGQEMYYSANGGDTWTIQGVLPSTCCDPTVGWSSDGSRAYVAALSSPSIGVSFWRSFNNGQTWQDRVNLTSGGSDKEFLHVDISPSSPYQDNIYLTYHNGNTMQFARSENFGDTFDITAFGGAPSGIGSDITTDSAGNIYYFYGAFNSQEITMLKSTNGGDSFGSPVAVDSTFGAFDFPIPSMESRRAWIYVAADADRSGGAFDGSVYAAWTDTTSPENDGSATANHTIIKVAYSRDGGNTWNFSSPHSLADTLTVDRYNQWLTVDEFGTVHVVFYDTRNSANRTGVDLYYNYSIDGGVTWDGLTRVSSATSANLNDGQEWGDYNGVSVIGEKIIPVWTDNRASAKDVYAADIMNEGASPTFTLSGDDNTSQSVCAPDSLTPISIGIGQVQEFSAPVSLSLSGLPGGINGNFSTNPVTPGTPAAQTTLSLSVGNVGSGSYAFDVVGAASGVDNKSLGINVDVVDNVPGIASLSQPANGAGSVSTAPEFSWSASQGQAYLIEIASDAGFGDIVYSANVSETTHVPDLSLEPTTTYYWRVTASNLCGDGATSSTFSFTTAAVFCQTSNLSIPDDGTDSTQFSVAGPGEISDLNVSLNVQHTYVGDLDFVLTHVETGTSVTIVDRPGEPAIGFFGCSGNDIDATLDDEAGSPIENECGGGQPTIDGTFSPNNALSAFDGEDIGGTWRITATDNAGADTGTLIEWCLEPEFSQTAPDADGDGLTDDEDNCTLVSNPSQCDSDGDDFGNACDGDLNNSGFVEFGDLNEFKTAFQTQDLDADFDCNGTVNFGDLAYFGSDLFGTAPGPSGTAP